MYMYFKVIINESRDVNSRIYVNFIILFGSFMFFSFVFRLLF